MDYKALLKQYMLHIVDQEGITFVGHSNEWFGMKSRFTPEQKAELERMENEIFSPVK